MSFLRPSSQALLSKRSNTTAAVGAEGMFNPAGIATLTIVGIGAAIFGGMHIYFKGVSRGCQDCREQDKQWVREGNVRFLGG